MSELETSPAPDKIAPPLSQFIAHRRAELKLSQRQLARRVGVTHAVISRLESGQSADLRFTTYLSLSAALQVHPMLLVEVYEGKLAPDSPLPEDRTVPVSPQNDSAHAVPSTPHLSLLN
jgi:transcriptional regulator with XRE-family HTH domain